MARARRQDRFLYGDPQDSQDAWLPMTVYQPLFILCPGRSFSSVVCTAIGQHPQLYGLPEIYLGIVDTLDQWFAMALKPGRKHMNQGLLRVIAQLHHGVQTEETILEARHWLQQCREWSTAKMYYYLAKRLATRRFVDKSPTLGKLRNMQRLLQIFPQAYFLHLLRHPRSTCNSFYNAKLAKTALYSRPVFDHLADSVEKHWFDIHHTILQFTASLPPSQILCLQGEDLLAEPDRYFLQIAEWLDIRTDAAAISAMKHPERCPYAHIGPPGAAYGNNRGFLENPVLKVGRPSPMSLEGPMGWSLEKRGFTPATIRLARQFGYQ